MFTGAQTSNAAKQAAPKAATASAPSAFPGIGRAATPREIAAWDIDVRPDFKGLPPGRGSVSQGQDVWEAKCAHCHGIFGESNEVFTPLIGGTTPDDVKTGHVASLLRPDYPGRTTLMKVSTLSTLWDYINRAMPWTAPKTLATDEVYAVLAYLLNLGHVVPDNFTLSNANVAEVQARMPNRHGMTTRHALWPGTELGGTAKPDTANVACMKDCAPEVKVGSLLPDFAKGSHGNLAEQSRLVGAQHGVGTPRATAPATAPTGLDPKPVQALLEQYACTACHGIANKIVGPAFNDIAKRHAGKADYLAAKIQSGGQGVWGPIPMPPQSLRAADAKTLANWLAGAP